MSSADGDDSLLSSLGFMFDAAHQKLTTEIYFQNTGIVRLRMIDGLPGHVQSGQYLWPAAKSLSMHLIENWNCITNDHISGCNDILELGAGCGLAGLLVGKLINAGTITFTDHDPGCLQLIEENIALNLSPHEHFSSDTSYYNNDGSSNSSSSSISSSSSSSSSNNSSSNNSSDSIVKHHVFHLSWGKQSLLSAENAPFRHRISVRKFPLIIGSDLIYCMEVVRLLLETVSLSMDDGGLFILATSFTLGHIIEEEIDRVAAELKLSRSCITSLNEEHGTCRIEYYRFDNTK